MTALFGFIRRARAANQQAARALNEAEKRIGNYARRLSRLEAEVDLYNYRHRNHQ